MCHSTKKPHSQKADFKNHGVFERIVNLISSIIVSGKKNSNAIPLCDPEESIHNLYINSIKLWEKKEERRK